MLKKLLFLLPCLLAFTLLASSKLPSAKIRRAVSEAIRAGDGKVLFDVLAKYGLHFNSVIMPGGYTLLHEAVVEGTPELVSYLLANDAEVNVTNDYGATPLDEATVFEKEEIAALLEQAGATHGEVLYVKAAPTKAAPINASHINQPIIVSHSNDRKRLIFQIPVGSAIIAMSATFNTPNTPWIGLGEFLRGHANSSSD